MAIMTAPSLYHALLAEGFAPPKDVLAESADIQVHMPADGVVQLHYVVNLEPEDLARLGRALTRMGERR